MNKSNLTQTKIQTFIPIIRKIQFNYNFSKSNFSIRSYLNFCLFLQQQKTHLSYDLTKKFILINKNSKLEENYLYVKIFDGHRI